ncbi:MAG: DNA primase, partial [Paracoccaceae bacterium]
MRFPDSFLDDLRSRLTLSDVVGRKVTWDRRKSQPGRGDYWAPCPFHHEKTPSFHADDRRGIYKCFGCGAGGDLFRFVMETENLSFAEAVERLASEAGVALPAPEGRARSREAEDPRKALFEVMEAAVAFYRRAFAAREGRTAREYAEGRGLSQATLERFEIGYAPDGGALARYLAETGRTAAGVEAGLLIAPEDGPSRAPFDRFRARLMFPIRDPRGRCIAFGGRALSAAAKAKYLNSPETPLFSKGKVLYNERAARAAATKAGTVIVAEGYMDVIALAQAGFDHAVAPLGTALTEEQLRRLWRMTPEPVIALDGDAAGLRAAHRAVDLALAGLGAERSLGFCLLPEGRDPDDVLRDGGAPAMQALVAASVPLVEMLWRRETEAGPLDTPERRAGFDRGLKEALGRIADAEVRAHYAQALRERRAALFAPERPRAKGAAGKGFGPPSRGGWPGGRRGG